MWCCSGEPKTETKQEVLPPEQPIEEPQPESTTFTCTIDKADGEWGMLFDGWPSGIQVLEVKPGGKVKEYNEGATEDLRLCVDDFILEIDGKEAVFDSLSELKEKTIATFKVARPARFRVKATKTKGTPWGLKMTYQEERSRMLRVDTINGGAIKELNKLAAVQVQPQDFIVEVNGYRGSHAAMLDVFKDSNVLELELTLFRVF